MTTTDSADGQWRRIILLLVRAAAWAMVIAIVVLSLVPPSARPTSSAPHDLEHFAAFAVAGGLQFVSYPAGLARWFLVAVIFCGTIELMQIAVPGRHARLEDFIVDAFAACLGIALACMATRAVAWR